jgi:hypothetical protein
MHAAEFDGFKNQSLCCGRESSSGVFFGRHANGLPSGAQQVPLTAPRGGLKLHA